MVNKLDDEQLSRVLSEHAIGNLARKGIFSILGKFTPCLYQAALNASNTDELVNEEGLDFSELDWFDGYYNSNWTTEEFIKKLTKQKLI